MTITAVAAWFNLLQNGSHDLFWQTVTVSVTIGMIFLIFFFIGISDPYGMFHIALNIRPGDDPTTAPETEWLNMGYWKVNIVCCAMSLFNLVEILTNCDFRTLKYFLSLVKVSWTYYSFI